MTDPRRESHNLKTTQVAWALQVDNSLSVSQHSVELAAGASPAGNLAAWVSKNRRSYGSPSPSGTSSDLDSSFIRAALVRGLALSCPAGETRLVLLRAGVRVPAARQWRQLVADAVVAHARSSVSAPAAARAARLEVARRLVARVLTPVDSAVGVSRQRVATARRALAVIAAHALRLVDAGTAAGTVIVTAGWLAVQLGVSERTAQLLIAAMRDQLRWLRVVRRLDGGARVYRLTRLAGDELSVVADHHADAVAALADRVAGGSALADVLTLADSPAWGYSAGVPAVGWLVAIGEAAGLGSKELVDRGVPPRRVAEARRWLAGVAGDGGLAGGLRRLELAGASQARARRLAEMRAVAAANRERAIERKAAAAARARAARWLKARVAVDAPGVGADRAAILTWLEAVASSAEQVQAADAEWAAALGEVVADRLAKAGLGAETAAAAAGRIVGILGVVSEADDGGAQ